MDRDQQWAADVRAVAAAALYDIANHHLYRTLSDTTRAELAMIAGDLREAVPDTEPEECRWCLTRECGAPGEGLLRGRKLECPLVWWSQADSGTAPGVRAEAARRATAVTLAYMARHTPADLIGQEVATMAVLTASWVPGDPCGVCGRRQGPCVPPCPIPVPAPWVK